MLLLTRNKLPRFNLLNFDGMEFVVGKPLGKLKIFVDHEYEEDVDLEIVATGINCDVIIF
jgi:hypothetical protein